MLCVHIVYTVRGAWMMKWLPACVLGEVNVGGGSLFSEMCVHGKVHAPCVQAEGR